MKKSKFLFVIVVLVGLSVILSVFLMTNYSRYKLSPEFLKMWVDLSPEEFITNKADVYPFTYAKIDEEGNLILWLSKDNIAAWKNNSSSMQVLQRVLGEDRDIGVQIIEPEDTIMKELYENAHLCGLEVSEDYTKIYESPDDNPRYFGATISGCILMQLLEGKDCDQISVEYTILNEKGEITRYIIWPDDVNENGELFYLS